MSVNIYTAAGLKKIAGSGFMDAELNENSNNGVKNSVLTRALSHIGLIIQSTTLDTEEKVIAIYGGEHWIRHTGYMLRGAATDVTPNQAQKDGGEDTHTLTVNEMPSHGHGITFNLHGGNINADFGGSVTGGYNLTTQNLSAWTATANGLIATSTGGGQAHNNLPSYKNVYIWERVS